MFLATKIIPGGFLPAIGFLLKEYWPMYLEGIKNTLVISLIGTVIGLVIALFIVPIKIQKISKRDKLSVKIVKRLSIILANVYVEVLRGTPMIVQAVIIYYGLVGLGVKFDINLGFMMIRWIIISGIFIVSINTSAYIVEVLRGAVEAIDKGQMEAARSLGMTRSQALMRIIIPQAVKNSIPAIGNEFVINIKDTAVLNVIAVSELFYETSKVTGIYYRQVEAFTIAAGIYLILTFTTTRILYLISRRLGAPRKSYPTSQSEGGNTWNQLFKLKGSKKALGKN